MAQQGKIFLFGILLYFFIRSSLIGSEDVEGAYFNQVSFHKLEGNSLQTIAVRSVLQCCMRCERVQECLSFNIAVLPTNNGLYDCVLLKNDNSESSEFLVPTQDYHHYTRFFGMCSIPRCKNGGTCITLVNDYRCHCRQRFTGKQCENPSCSTSSALGMEDGRIPDQQLTASSVYSYQYLPAYGRLNFKANIPYIYGAWAVKTKDANQWFQVDLGSVAKVTGIETQGGPILTEWVTSYGLQYSADNSIYEDYEGGKSFSGNSDKNTVVKNDVNPAIFARYIRVRPKTWNDHITMRVELYGCK